MLARQGIRLGQEFAGRSKTGAEMTLMSVGVATPTQFESNVRRALDFILQVAEQIPELTREGHDLDESNNEQDSCLESSRSMARQRVLPKTDLQSQLQLSKAINMGLQVLTEEEVDMVSGGGSGGFIRGCVNGGMAGLGAAASGYGAQGAGAGCLAGGSVGMIGGGAEAQALAGYFAGLAFGPYGGSSSNPVAANYENSFDRQDSGRRMARI